MRTTNLLDEEIRNQIFHLRGWNVILDQDLAELYDVSTKRMNEQVRRNLERFPSDFMFQLSEDEMTNLRSHSATSSWGGRRYMPYAFTEHGILMLSSVLRSKQAIAVNIRIMRIFVKMRKVMMNHQELSQKVMELEKAVNKNDDQIDELFTCLKMLLSPSGQKNERRKIGFQ